MPAYLFQLAGRMAEALFAPDDKLFLLTRKARVVIQEAVMACHYASCEDGVG